MNITFKYNIGTPTRHDTHVVYLISCEGTEEECSNRANSFIHKNIGAFKNWGADVERDKLTKLEPGEVINKVMKNFNV